MRNFVKHGVGPAVQHKSCGRVACLWEVCFSLASARETRHAEGMSTSSAQDLADALYSLREREFYRPRDRFPGERRAVLRLVEEAKRLGRAEFHLFGRELVRAISVFCGDGNVDQGVLYRAFDDVDVVLGIDYQEARETMLQSTGAERLYEGGGAGVQTSYSTILKVFEALNPQAHSHLVDLGSGFGRVGIISGLWREDLRFSGYEYVGHRVAAANASAERAGVAGQVRFFEQDLSDPSFQIPEADAYYLYDPFSASTYQHVFRRLAELSRERSISIIVKADAREGFRRWMDDRDWFPPEPVDQGTVLLFRSRRSMR